MIDGILSDTRILGLSRLKNTVYTSGQSPSCTIEHGISIERDSTALSWFFSLTLDTGSILALVTFPVSCIRLRLQAAWWNVPFNSSRNSGEISFRKRITASSREIFDSFRRKAAVIRSCPKMAAEECFRWKFSSCISAHISSLNVDEHIAWYCLRSRKAYFNAISQIRNDFKPIKNINGYICIAGDRSAPKSNTLISYQIHSVRIHDQRFNLHEKKWQCLTGTRNSPS